MDMVAVLNHCFHMVKNRLQENDLAVLDENIPKDNNCRDYLAEYIEEYSAPFVEMAENENQGDGVKLIFQKYYSNQASLKSMLAFLQEFARKPVSEIDQSHHAEGIKAFKNFIRRWENNVQGNDLVALYNRFNASFG